MALNENALDVWLAYDEKFQDADVQEEFAALMTAAELERMQRLHFETGRRQFALTRALQRKVLSLYAADVLPAEWRFRSSPEGRPSLAPPFDATGLHFNLAHTAGVVAMAVCRHERIGVDVESLGRAPLAVVERYFSAAEAAQLRALPPEAQARRFMQLWTLKESYLKAIGTGLAGGLSRMSFHFEGAETIRFERADDADAPRWQFIQRAIGGPHLLAIAVLPPAGSGSIEMNLREFRA